MQEARRYQLVALFAAVLVAIVAFFHPRQSTAPTTVNNINSSTTVNTNAATNGNTNTNPDNPDLGMRFYTADLPDADAAFYFSLQLPADWLSSYDVAKKSVVFTDADGAVKILVSYYQANDFAVPPGTISAGPVTKTFAQQAGRQYTLAVSGSTTPSWLNQAHSLVDIKKPNSLPAVIYRFVISPDITSTTAQAILTSLNFTGAVH